MRLNAKVTATGVAQVEQLAMTQTRPDPLVATVRKSIARREAGTAGNRIDSNNCFCSLQFSVAANALERATSRGKGGVVVWMIRYLGHVFGMHDSVVRVHDEDRP